MLQHISTFMQQVMALNPFSGATWLVIAIIGFFIWLFSKAQRNPNSPITWEDLFVDTSTNRASPYKIGYMIGLIVGTWIVISMHDKNSLSFDIFGVYLAYLLGVAGWNMSSQRKHEYYPSPQPVERPDAPGNAPPSGNDQIPTPSYGTMEATPPAAPAQQSRSVTKRQPPAGAPSINDLVRPMPKK